MPSAHEFVAHNRTEDEIGVEIGADWLVYQDLDELEKAVRRGNKNIKRFDTSCFNADYVTGDVNQAYLDRIDSVRNDTAKTVQVMNPAVIDLHNSN
jgi:amidophosphoribosyltransferase